MRFGFYHIEFFVNIFNVTMTLVLEEKRFNDRGYIKIMEELF